MAIAVDAITTVYNSATSASPAAGNHVVSGVNRCVFGWATSNGGTPTTWTASDNGVACTRIGTGSSHGAALFGLIAPATGTISFSVSHDVAGGPLIIQVITLTGVDQTTAWSNYLAGTSGTGSNPQVTISSSASNWVLDFLFSRASITGVNQTQNSDGVVNSGSCGQAIGHSTGSASQLMGWTVAASGDTNWDAGVNVNAASTGGFRRFYNDGGKFYGTQYAPVSPMERNLAVMRYQRERAAQMRDFMRRVARNDSLRRAA